MKGVYFMVKSYYLMSKKQFEEMKSFYKTLGYTDEQIAKLCKYCFGAEIRVNESSEEYSGNWTFRRLQEGYYDDAPLRGIHYSKSSTSGNIFSRMSRATESNAGMLFNMERNIAPESMMGFVCADSMCEEPDEIFNTAETNVSKEHEELSPMDSPQCIFSANVNSASWSYVRNKVLLEEHIGKDFVREEEIINSYKYNLTSPENGELFSITSEKTKCPWNDDSDLFFLGIKAKKADESVKQNLAFLVDVSGSMDDNWILVQMSIAAIVSKLKKGDVMSIISYSNKTETVVKELDCEDLDKCVDAILKIDGIGGCTYGSDGMEKAYKYLAERYDENANNRIFVFTDGDFNFGITSEGRLKDLIYKKRATGIYLSIVGYGFDNFKDNKMETMAKNGNGNYTFVSHPDDILENLWTKLVSNLVTVAKDVKISVEFNPKYVSSYRLLGYDSRGLTVQEFNDTEKAVDGIGSEHNVVALVEIKLGEAEQKSSSRYVQANINDVNDEFAFVEIHYKSPDGENLVMEKTIMFDEISKSASNNIVAASILATFGLLLKDSEYKGNADTKLLESLVEEFSDDQPHFDIIKKYLKNIY